MRIKTVLCPVDFTPLSDRSLQLAVDVCRRFDARLVVEHHTGESLPGPVGVSWMRMEGVTLPERRAAHDPSDCLKKLLEELPGDLARTGRVTHGPLSPSLLQTAKEVKADLIVMGSNGWGGAEHHSVTEELIARAPCPVLGVNEGSVGTDFFATARPAPDHPARVLIPVGFSRYSLRAVEQAVLLAREFAMHLTFLHITSTRERGAGTGSSTDWAARRQAALEERIHALLPDPPPEKTCISFPGKPGREIVRLASEIQADLIVMGGHHAGLFKHLFSPPTSCEVLHECACPVWFVPMPVRSRGARSRTAA